MLSDLLQDVSIGQVTPWTILLLVMALVLRGRLVTRQQLLDMIADRDHWRDSTNALLAAVHEQGMAVHDLGRAVDRLTALGETSNHALTEIQRELERGLEQRP